MTDNEHTTIAVMQNDIKYIREAVTELKDNQRLYVTKTEFWPIRMLVYGFVGAVMLGVIGYWVNTSLKPCCVANASVTNTSDGK